MLTLVRTRGGENTKTIYFDSLPPDHPLVQTVGQITYRDVTFSVAHKRGTGEATIFASDIYTQCADNPTGIQGFALECEVTLDATPEHIFKAIWDMITEFEEHERKEFLKFDGKKIYDPHKIIA